MMQYISIVFIRDPSSEELQELRKVHNTSTNLLRYPRNVIHDMKQHLDSASFETRADEKPASQSKSEQSAYNVQPRRALKTGIFWRMWLAEVIRVDLT